MENQITIEELFQNQILYENNLRFLLDDFGLIDFCRGL